MTGTLRECWAWGSTLELGTNSPRPGSARDSTLFTVILGWLVQGLKTRSGPNGPGTWVGLSTWDIGPTQTWDPRTNLGLRRFSLPREFIVIRYDP